MKTLIKNTIGKFCAVAAATIILTAPLSAQDLTEKPTTLSYTFRCPVKPVVKPVSSAAARSSAFKCGSIIVPKSDAPKNRTD